MVSAPEVSVAAQPVALSAVRRTRAQGALIGLTVGAALGYRLHHDWWLAGCIGLISAVMCMMIFWAVAVKLWQMALGLTAEDARQRAIDQIEQRRAQALARAEQRAQEDAGDGQP